MAHTRTSGKDPRQGSMFCETVLLPTLAPQIARPYHLPGVPEALQRVLGCEVEGQNLGKNLL
jgi:hypothetical protein